MNDRLSKAEIRKDALQEGFTAATHTVGTVAGIVVGAVGDVGRALGGFATELFEIRDSVRRAGRDHPDVVVSTEEPGPGSPNEG
jgi:hypothetical protein